MLSTMSLAVARGSLRSPVLPASSFCRLSLSSRKAGFNPIASQRRGFRTSSGYLRSSGIDPVNAIIAANGLVFVCWHLSTSSRKYWRFMNEHFTLSTHKVLGKLRLHTLLTSTFSHKDFMHFGINMFVFYQFGKEILHLLGRQWFYGLYFGGALFSSACQAIWPMVVPRSWPSWSTSQPYQPCLGASGAVNAVVIYNILAISQGTVYLYFVPLPKLLFGLGYICVDAYRLYNGNTNTGSASHLGGMAFGAFMYLVTRRRWRF